MDTGSVSPLLERADAQESITAPQWWPGGAGVLFERDDVNSQLPALFAVRGSDRLLVPAEFVGDGGAHAEASSGWLFGACVALAHGLPWDVWLVRPDGTDAHELAQVQADGGAVAWSPDGPPLLVYGGSGGYLVDANSGEFQRLAYLSGYGSIAWLEQ
jgi:hypothetical protein